MTAVTGTFSFSIRHSACTVSCVNLAPIFAGTGLVFGRQCQFLLFFLINFKQIAAGSANHFNVIEAAEALNTLWHKLADKVHFSYYLWVLQATHNEDYDAL